MIGGKLMIGKCGHSVWHIRSIMADFIWCPVCDKPIVSPLRKDTHL